MAAKEGSGGLVVKGGVFMEVLKEGGMEMVGMRSLPVIQTTLGMPPGRTCEWRYPELVS